MKNKIGLLLLLLVELAIMFVCIKAVISLFVDGELVYAIVTMYGTLGLAYCMGILETLEAVIDSFKQDRGQ